MFWREFGKYIMMRILNISVCHLFISWWKILIHRGRVESETLRLQRCHIFIPSMCVCVPVDKYHTKGEDSRLPTINCRSSPHEGLHRQCLLSSKIKIKEICFCSLKKSIVLIFHRENKVSPELQDKTGRPVPWWVAPSCWEGRIPETKSFTSYNFRRASL